MFRGVHVGARRKTITLTNIESVYAIGIDPGKATGFAVLRRGIVTTSELDFNETCITLESLLQEPHDIVVAIERFTFQAASTRMTRQYDALELIGVTRFLCTKYKKYLRIYGAAEAARIGSPAVLKKLGWWTSGKDHANKATAQIATALSNIYPQEFENLLNPGTI